jgi:formamidase
LTRKLGVAGLQLKKDPNDAESNIIKFETMTRTAKASYSWVDLIFTGELYLQQYGTKDWKDFAEPIPNSLTDRLSRLAKRIHCWLVPGSFLERDGSRIFNTSIAFNPDGEIVAKYRKIFPWAPHEDTDQGTEFITFDIPGIARVGMTICYDLWFPELFRTLAWMGSEVILQPSATYTPDRDAELILTPAQAIMHQCYVLNVNTISPYGGGRSMFADPEGHVIQKTGTHEEMMIEVIDIDKVAWIRQYGSFALNPVWKSFRDSPLNGKFPPYENLLDGEILKKLGEMKLQKSIRDWDI